MHTFILTYMHTRIGRLWPRCRVNPRPSRTGFVPGVSGGAGTGRCGACSYSEQSPTTYFALRAFASRFKPLCILLFVCMHACIRTYMHTYMHIHIHTYKHTGMHMHLYMHT